MSLAHDLIDAALEADLSKNELKAFLVLFRQTLCFGKTSDALTFKRIAKVSGIRKDRIKPALKRLVEVGLFDTTPHKVFEHTYTLAAHFLAKQDAEVVTPILPKNGTSFRNWGEKLPEKRLHTVIPTTEEKTTTTTDNPRTKTEPVAPPCPTMTEGSGSGDFNSVELPYPTAWDTHQRTQAAQVLDGLTPDQAHDCLLLLANGLNKGKVKAAMGYLHTLARAARNNTLDRSTLPSLNRPQSPLSDLNTQPMTKPSPDRLTALMAEIKGLDALYQRAGIPMDTKTAQQRAQWVDQYNQLKAQGAQA